MFCSGVKQFFEWVLCGWRAEGGGASNSQSLPLHVSIGGSGQRGPIGAKKACERPCGPPLAVDASDSSLSKLRYLCGIAKCRNMESPSV